MLAFFLISSPIFAVVVLGYAAGRARLVTSEGFTAFATYAFDVALPALIVVLLVRQPLTQAFEPRFFLAMLAAGLAVFVATAGLTLTVGRADLPVAGAHAQAATTGNLGFLGVPLIVAILGERGAGPLAMVILSEVGVLMPLGVGVMSLRARRAAGGRPLLEELARATLLNPIVLAVGAGATVGLSGGHLPAVIERFLAFVGASAGPTALFALGGSLAGRRLGRDWHWVVAVAAAKLLVYPAVAWSLVRLGAGLDRSWAAAGALIAALPTAANVFVFAQRMEAVPERVSAEILLSTVAGAVTFPLVAWLVLP
jgi:predicted permease